MKILEIDDVNTPNKLIEFMQQRTGVPTRHTDTVQFKAQLKAYLAKNPNYTVRDLAKVVLWGQGRGKRPSSLTSLFYWAGDAYRAGALHAAVTPRVDALRGEIYAALAEEADPQWRQWLMGASSIKAMTETLAAWREHRAKTVEKPVKKRAKQKPVEQAALAI